MTEIDLSDPQLQSQETISKNEQLVRQRFWRKLRRIASHVPFAQELVAAYYCAFDPATPPRVKAVLLGALGYFIIPSDMIPDFIVALGFTDDATVLATAIGMVAAHIKPEHKAKAEVFLQAQETAGADAVVRER